MLRWQESVGSGLDPRVLHLEMTLTRLFHHQANLLLTSLTQTKSLLSSDTWYAQHTIIVHYPAADFIHMRI